MKTPAEPLAKTTANPMRRAAWIGVLGAGVTLAVLVVAALGSIERSCEVCIVFRGRQVCREALGPTAEEARRTATSNACGLLAGGMTETIECQNTPPARVTCDGD